METRLFLKIVSLLLAVGLYVIVSEDLLNSTRNIASFFPTETTTEETVEDVPVVVNYDSDKYIISGIPETVDVTFKGSSSLVRVTLNKGEYQVVADLTEATEGEGTVVFQVIGHENGVEATVHPAEVPVTIKEKATVEFPVSLIVEGEDSLRSSGYVMTDSSLDTQKVEVVGTREATEQITTVQAVVNVAGRESGFTETVELVAYNSNGELVGGIIMTPSTAEATVTIVQVGEAVSSKDVPLKVHTTGTARSGVFIEGISVAPETVTIFGEESVLAAVTEVGVNVDISEVTKNTEKTVVLITPANIRAISPSKVTAKIQLEEAEARSFSDVSIATRNIPSDLEIVSQEASTATVSVTAVPSILNSLNNDDITLFIDLSELSAGTHSVLLQAEALENAEVSTDSQMIGIELSKKATEGTTNNDTNGSDSPEDGTTEDGTTEEGTTPEDGAPEDGTATEDDTPEEEVTTDEDVTNNSDDNVENN